MRRALLGLLIALGCRPTAPPSSPPTPEENAGFARRAEALIDGRLEGDPGRAVDLGLHAHDGKLPDVTPAGLEAREAWLRASIEELDAVDVTSLSSMQQVERAALRAALSGDLLELEVERKPWRNPMFYLDALDLTAYISRDYAPLPDRAAAIIAIAEATPAFLKQATENLEPSLPRTFVNTGLLQARGVAAFVRTDVPVATRDLPPRERTALADALAKMATALDLFAAELERKQAKANGDFALGEEGFMRLLHEAQGIDVDLPRLTAILQADLDRNVAAMQAAAQQIDAQRPVAEVVAEVAAQKPQLDAVLSTAEEQAAQMRQFLIDREIVTIPTEHVARVVETPPFMRWNAAFLNSAGVFESKPLPSFYYISPPDPSWPPEKQRAYVPGTTDLLFITIHEVWPGHFLHSLHLKGNDSIVLKAVWNYVTSEGWAHYAEEMMWNEGVSDDPRVHVGQLLNALLRNVRAMSAIGLHTQGWSVERSRDMFIEVAFQDEANAEQQAVRGTFDPMYLAYTVGKLAILQLWNDTVGLRGDMTMREFHDELLSYGAAPLSAIRTAMLGPDWGPVL